jgi:putative sterol carrier protein
MGNLVECHSGFTYADRPVALTWEGQRLEIVQILAEWHTPEKKHFRVRTTDGREFELAYSQATNDWQIQAAWRLDGGDF